MFSHLATSGALITVLALAIDPFTQQIIHPVTCDRVVPGSVCKLPCARIITAKFYIMSGASTAMILGLLSDYQMLDYGCSTGNCTFRSASNSTEAFQTLGIESSCVDISHQIEKKNPIGWSIPRLGNVTSIVSHYNVTRTFLSYPNLEGCPSSYNPKVFEKYWPEEERPNWDVQRFASLINTTEWECYATNTQEKALDECIKPLAVECCLWFSVQTMSVHVELGRLEEKVITSHRIPISHSFNNQAITFVTYRDARWK